MVKIREYWLQLENHSWDVSPWGVNRTSPVSLPGAAGGTFRPTAQQVLVIRAYTANWALPADQPVNPWDLVELNPSLMPGTMPGAIVEAKVADEIVVHFRNMDSRQSVPVAERTHSLRPHGVQSSPLYAGAYPLSPSDPSQGGKRGDRVAPGDSFTYRWSCPQRATAGAWLYRDGSLAAAQSVALGAFGVIIIRAPGEQEPDLPAKPVRQVGDTATRFAAVPAPPKRGEYVLAFHELPGVGLCLNGHQALGNTPSLVAGEGTRMNLHCLNATAQPLTVHVHGHRWQRGDRWVDAEVLPAGGSATLEMLEASAENGGGLGEWLVTGLAASGANILCSLVTTNGGAVMLASA